MTMNNLNTSDYQISDLFFNNNKGFPEQTFNNVIENKAESTELLLKHLEDAYIDHLRLTEDEAYYGVIHASYLLAQFREKRAFPLIMKLLGLPLRSLCNLYGDFLLDIHRLLASVYNGDFESIAHYIENENIDSSVRNKALLALCVLVNESLIERNFVIDYFLSLIKGPLKIVSDENVLLWFEIIKASIYFNAVELKIEIKNILDAKDQYLNHLRLSNEELVDLLFSEPAEKFQLELDNLKIISNATEKLKECTRLYDCQKVGTRK